MKVLYDDKPTMVCVVLDKKEASALIEVLAVAITGKPVSKRSNAYKLAERLDGEMPVF